MTFIKDAPNQNIGKPLFDQNKTKDRITQIGHGHQCPREEKQILMVQAQF
jgi:hypothetical protein